MSNVKLTTERKVTARMSGIDEEYRIVADESETIWVHMDDVCERYIYCNSLQEARDLARAIIDTADAMEAL